MNSNSNVTQKEISNGIILLKHIQNTPDHLIYTFKVQLNRLNDCQFVADFTGSENIILQSNDTFISITLLSPFQTQEVAKLILKNDWKLKTKFKFTLRPTSKENQLKYMQDDLNNLNNQINQSIATLALFPINQREVNEIIKFINNSLYIDPEFKPNDESVFGISTDNNALDTLIQWRRPDQFFALKDANKRPEIFFEKIEPNDIKQGALGNCWFLSALSSLAERPNLVKRLFVTTIVNASGIYRVKLCKNGEWIYVTLDDLFPCYPLGTPIFSSAHGNELWVLLLEKAYAKVHGSYFALRSGISSEAMIDLTGCPTDTILFDVEKLQKNYTKVWSTLQKYDEEGYLINAFTEGNDQWSEGQRPANDTIGLVPGHAYAVLQVQEAKGVQLLNIRNPWGNFEWKGDWSDTSPLWTQEMKNQVNFVNDANDGQFWMCLKDFLNFFRGANVCKVRNWDEVRVKGKFVKVSDINDPNIQVVLSKWYYTINLPQPTKIIVGIHQEDERCLAVNMLRGYLDIGITVFKKGENGVLDLVKQTTSKVDRQIELELDLIAGQYLILPRTTGLNLRRPPSIIQQDIQFIINNELHPLVKSCIYDIFRKYDMLLTRELSYIEFKGFYDCLDKQIEPQYFKTQILAKYCSTEKGITLKGFNDFFIDQIQIQGQETIWKWFEKLGYDRNLCSIRSRTFIFTLHSISELSVTVRDAINTDLDNRAHVFGCTSALDEFSQIEQLPIEPEGVRALQCYNRLADMFTIVAVNDLTYPVDLTLDLSNSFGLIYSNRNATVKKRLEAGQMESMIHYKGDGIQKFKISIKSKWVPV